MVELATAEDARFAVSDCDIVREGATYTFDTVQIFRQQFPSAPGGGRQRQPDEAAHMEKMADARAPTNIAVAMRQGDSLHQTPRELHAWLGKSASGRQRPYLVRPDA